MTRVLTSFFLFLGAALLLFFAFYGDKMRAEKRPSILVSIPPYTFLVKEIAGDDFAVKSITSGNSNPHTFDPKPQEAASYMKSVIWFSTGEAFEGKIGKALPKTTHVINLNEGLPLLAAQCHHEHEHDEDGACILQEAHLDAMDLHTWLSPKLFREQAKRIAETLVDHYPEQRELFFTRLNEVNKRIEKLEEESSKKLAPFAGRTLLFSHPAFAYYCQDFHLHQLSVEVDGKEPTIQQIQTLLDEAKKRGVSQMILMPQYSNKGANKVANELNLKSITINPYAEDYIKNFTSITDKIVQGETR